MSTNTYKKRDIKLLNKDFNSLKQSLVDHIKVYFPDDYQDFNQSSIGMMLVELGAYIGDAFNFYLDKKFQESFLHTATEKKNIFNHAKHLDFKAFGKTASKGKVDLFIDVPNTIENGRNIPDLRYAGIAKKGTRLQGNNGKQYETLIDADFSNVNIYSNSFATVSKRDGSGNPTFWTLKVSDIDVISGETKTASYTIGAFEKYRKITIEDQDVYEIISVVDSDGYSWYEVDYLAQDTIFDSVLNTASDSSTVPYVIKLISVPRRFISEYDIVTNKTSLIFGTGDVSSFDDELIPNIADLSLPLYGKDTFTDYSIDPQNFLKTRTLGLSPSNTTLTVKYRVGGGDNSKSGANQIRSVSELVYEITDSSLDQSLIAEGKNSFSCTNPLPVLGGKDEFSTDELVQLISANFAAQNRMVTPEDFIIRCLAMPSKYGSIFRASVKNSNLNKNVVELSVVTQDQNGYLTVAPSSLKSNLKNYLSKFRLMTDAIDILDAEIINFSVNFGIVVKPEYNKNDVMISCIQGLKDYFLIDRWQISQPINKTQLRTLIAELPGVLSIFNLTIMNKVGTMNGLSYSTTSHNIDANTFNDIIYCKENSIFELKYPNKDITIMSK